MDPAKHRKPFEINVQGLVRKVRQSKEESLQRKKNEKKAKYEEKKRRERERYCQKKAQKQLQNKIEETFTIEKTHLEPGTSQTSTTKAKDSTSKTTDLPSAEKDRSNKDTMKQKILEKKFKVGSRGKASKNKKKTRENIEKKRRKDRERQRIRREKLRTNPEKYHEFLKKEREIYKQKKQNKKKISNMSFKEKLEQRKKWRQIKREQRSKKKEEKKAEEFIANNSPPESRAATPALVEPEENQQEKVNKPAQGDVHQQKIEKTPEKVYKQLRRMAEADLISTPNVKSERNGLGDPNAILSFSRVKLESNDFEIKAREEIIRDDIMMDYTSFGDQNSDQQCTDISFNRLQSDQNQTCQSTSIPLNQLPNPLRELLIEWDLEELESYFIEEKITIEVLKVIKRHHLEKLFRDVPIGTQILFEHHLEMWRNAIGIPLDNTFPKELCFINSNSQLLKATTPSISASSSHPYSRPETPSDTGSRITLADILNTSKGKMLCSLYDTNKTFTEDERNVLLNLICQYYDEKQIPMSLGGSYQIEKEILSRFKNEKLEYYRTKKRGKLYNKCCNQKKIIVDKAPKTDKVVNSRFKQNFVPENDAEAFLTALKFETLSSDEFDSFWKACSQYRLKDLKTMSSTGDIFEKWFFYKKAFGYRLVDLDYEIAFGQGELLLHWEKYFPSIVAFLRRNVKDKAARALLEKAAVHASNENGKYAAVMWAAHAYLVPSSKYCHKNEAGKKLHTKYTIKDSQESVLFLASTQQEIEEHITNLKKRKTAIQPLITCIGKNITEITNISLYFDDVRYTFFHVIKAVDTCFKIFYLFNLDFPLESKMFYNFLERGFYNHDVPLESPKVQLFCEALKG